MKRMRKLMALMLAVAMTLTMSITAYAQTVQKTPADPDNATITINNPAKGETYKIYKLFDATVGTDGTTIAYQSTSGIPDGLDSFFIRNEQSGYITPSSNILQDNTTTMTSELQSALERWAATAEVTASANSDGSKLEFTGLPYGYYVVTTTHKSDPAEGEQAKSAITVTSTQPHASIFDKNVNEPSVSKNVDKESYSIGDTVKYTATFDTTNYLLSGDDASQSKQVINYEISDTLPEFLSDVKITSISINGEKYPKEGETPNFENKKIMIQWATEIEPITNPDGTQVKQYQNIYPQGAQIVIKYEAKLTSTTHIGAFDINTITILPYTYDGKPGTPEGGDPWHESWEDKAEIKTYAAALKKVDPSGNALSGATFKIKGLSWNKIEAGVYEVVSYDPNGADSAEMDTDAQGKLYILGLADDVNLSVTEFKAPDGYNKLTEAKTVSSQLLSVSINKTSGTNYYDKDGNLVTSESDVVSTKTVEKNLNELDAAALEIENNQGTLLPSTGGIGTTIFYIIGGILVVGAAILLVTKKRMSKEA